MTEKELLEASARAAGIMCSWAHEDEADYFASTEGMWLNGARSPDNSKFWNPLTDDGDALRLAVKLRLNLPTDICFAEVPHEKQCEATRRAIVRAAAEKTKDGKNE